LLRVKPLIDVAFCFLGSDRHACSRGGSGRLLVVRSSGIGRCSADVVASPWLLKNLPVYSVWHGEASIGESSRDEAWR